MTRLFLSVLATLAVAGVVLAATPSCQVPQATGYAVGSARYGYSVAPANYQGYRPFYVNIAELTFPLIDVGAKDFFFFNGPPPRIGGVVAGISATGQEVQLPPQAAQQGQPAPAAPPAPDHRRETVRAVAAADESRDHGQPVLGYEEGAKIVRTRPPEGEAPPNTPTGPGRPSAALAAGLRASCFDCHGPKAKGDFVMFDAAGGLTRGVDWVLVASVLGKPAEPFPGGKAAQPARMPPQSSGKPALSEAQVNEVRALADRANAGKKADG